MFSSLVPNVVAEWWPYAATSALVVSTAAHFFDVALAVRFLKLCARDTVPAWLLMPWQKRSKPDLKAFLSEHVHKATVTTRDLDLMVHMNNARYPREADFARHGLFNVSGVYRAATVAGTPLVTAAQTIRYRRELPYGSKFEVRTKVVGMDDKAFILQQLFVCHGDVFAVMFVREAASPGRKRVDLPVKALRARLGWDNAAVAAITGDTAGLTLPEDVKVWLQSTIDASERVVTKRT
jgi:acyl-CoA thioesterase FadM